jgi:hypothetical protein
MKTTPTLAAGMCCNDDGLHEIHHIDNGRGSYVRNVIGLFVKRLGFDSQ